MQENSEHDVNPIIPRLPGEGVTPLVHKGEGLSSLVYSTRQVEDVPDTRFHVLVSLCLSLSASNNTPDDDSRGGGGQQLL